MHEFIRAATQFACEITIYGCERVLEHLAAERPNMDDPLPDDQLADAIHDDFSGYRFGLTQADFADLGQRFERINEAERNTKPPR